MDPQRTRYKMTGAAMALSSAVRDAPELSGSAVMVMQLALAVANLLLCSLQRVARRGQNALGICHAFLRCSLGCLRSAHILGACGNLVIK